MPCTRTVAVKTSERRYPVEASSATGEQVTGMERGAPLVTGRADRYSPTPEGVTAICVPAAEGDARTVMPDAAVHDTVTAALRACGGGAREALVERSI